MQKMAKHCIPDYGKTLLSRRWQDSVIQKMARHGNPEDGKTYWSRQRQNIMKGGMKTSLNWNSLSNVFLQMLQTFLEPWDAVGILLQMLQMEQDPGGDDRPPALSTLISPYDTPLPHPFSLPALYYVLPLSGSLCFAIFWFTLSCHLLDLNVLP